MRHVPLVQIGNVLLGPRKQECPHFCNITVRSCVPGFSLLQPRVAEPLPFLRVILSCRGTFNTTGVIKQNRSSHWHLILHIYIRIHDDSPDSQERIR